MSDDHLSNEISVSAELTPTGVKAAAKSRILSAIDRIVGGAIDRFTPKLEGPAALARSNNAREVRINDALTDKMVEMIHADPALAERALERHLGSIGRRQENKEAVVALALEDLTNSPPSEEQNDAGPEALDETFLNRLERFAEDATSEQLRERWGRVLAAEIRRPGTFSAKVMRVVDELDASTALLFETVCQFRVGNVLPTSLLPEIPFIDQKRLVAADLIFDPGLGQARIGSNTEDKAGTSLRIVPFGKYNFAVVADETLALGASEASVVNDHEGKPAVAVWILTDAGHAVSSILPDNELGAFRSLVELVAEQFKGKEIREYHEQSGSDHLVMARSISRPIEPSASGE